MKQKLFLTSALAMGVMAPAMAEPSNTGTFPADGYMEEDYTYTNAATEANMGVYEGSVNATAEYDTIDYILTAGKYLPADSETITTCPAGSFCAGGTTVQYNQSSAQGIETCPSGFGSSADGSSSNTQCYRTCDINNMGANGSIANIAHATAISGNDYYGSGTDTCAPTACENGWHVKDAVPDLKTIIGLTDNLSNGGFIAAFIRNDGTSENQEKITEYGYTSNDRNLFFIDFKNLGLGKIVGYGRCSTKQSTITFDGLNSTFSVESSLLDETGQEGAVYCYCRLTSYTPTDGNTQNFSSGSWIAGMGNFTVYGGYQECARGCPGSCLQTIINSSHQSSNLAWRGAFFDSIGTPGPAMCEANTITINWSNADAEDISANNAGTATYDSDIRTPVKAQTIKGKTFKGWRFSKPETTNLP